MISTYFLGKKPDFYEGGGLIGVNWTLDLSGLTWKERERERGEKAKINKIRLGVLECVLVFKLVDFIKNLPTLPEREKKLLGFVLKLNMKAFTSTNVHKLKLANLITHSSSSSSRGNQSPFVVSFSEKGFLLRWGSMSEEPQVCQDW